MKIAIVGGGVMGEALLAGLTRAGGHEVVVVEQRSERAEELARTWQVTASADAALVGGMGLVILMVKPQDMAATLAEVAPHVGAGTAVVSVAAGLTTAFLEERLPEGTAVIRAMPNTPAVIGQGVTGISPGSACEAADLDRAESVLGVTGKVVRIPEDLQNALTAVSGSGPAYVFAMAEALRDAGVAAGLPAATASELAIGTIVGAAGLLAADGADPADLRARVTSKGGTTAAALASLQADDFAGIWRRAVAAAVRRAEELADG